jgi:hypothetical protein
VPSKPAAWHGARVAVELAHLLWLVFERQRPTSSACSDSSVRHPPWLTEYRVNVFHGALWLVNNAIAFGAHLQDFESKCIRGIGNGEFVDNNAFPTTPL